MQNRVKTEIKMEKETQGSEGVGWEGWKGRAEENRDYEVKL